MAGDWIKLETATSRKPKVLHIARLVGQNRWDVVGRLSEIWGWADQNSTDGTLPGLVDEDIDDLVQCPGFAKAMRAVGYLGGEPGRLLLPNWEQHNSMSAKARALEAEAKRLRREMEDHGQNAAGVSDKGSDKGRTEPGAERRTRERGRVSSGSRARAHARARPTTTTAKTAGDAEAGARAEVPYRQIVEAWNELCPRLDPVLGASPKRTAAIGVLWDYVGANMEGVQALFERVNGSRLLHGEKHPTKTDRAGYRTRFDWVIRPDNAVRILEGEFDDAKGGTP